MLKLKAKLIECGLTQEAIAKKMGLSIGCFSNKINRKVPFTIAEAQKIRKILRLTDAELISIFFA